MDFSVILFPLKLNSNRIYTTPAAQRLTFKLGIALSTPDSNRRKKYLNAYDYAILLIFYSH